MLSGMGISDGIGIGNAVILNDEDIKIEKIKIDNIEQEKKTFLNAVKAVQSETEELIKKLNGTEKDIMQAYLMILQDDTLIQETMKIIEDEKCNSAYGVEIGFNKIIRMFDQMDDPYMAARSLDIADMKRKILGKILNIEEINLSNLPKNTILVAKELMASNTAKLDLKNIEGIITEIGGENSHTAIMARTNKIPMIVGVKNVTNLINENDIIAINGKSGEIYINPSKQKIENGIMLSNNKNITKELITANLKSDEIGYKWECTEYEKKVYGRAYSVTGLNYKKELLKERLWNVPMWRLLLKIYHKIKQ